VPHAVYDEMLRRSQNDADLGCLVRLLNERVVSFGRPKFTSAVRQKSMEYANKYAVPEYDRISMAHALSYVILTDERSAFISHNSSHTAAFRKMRSDIGISDDKAAIYVFRKGVYTPLVPIRLN